MSRQGSPSASNAKQMPTPAPAKPASNAASGGMATVAQTVEAKPSVDAVRARAFEIYQDRTKSGKSGTQQSDWAQAERELSQRR